MNFVNIIFAVLLVFGLFSVFKYLFKLPNIIPIVIPLIIIAFII